MTPLDESLLAALPPTLRDEVERGRLADSLVRIVDRGREEMPEFATPDEAWARHFARHLRAGEVASQVSDMHAADVHLALACLAGHVRALARLDARMQRTVGQALGRIRLGSVTVDEVLQEARAKLLVGVLGGEGEPRLVTYSGRGPLDGWLRVVLARTALSLLRRHGSQPVDVDDDAALSQAVATDNQELAVLRERCGPVVKQALEDAVAALSDADRTLLRLHAVDGLTIDDLAALYRAHRTTLGRRVARIRSALFVAARKRTMDRMGIGEEEFDSLMGLMGSALEVTLTRILGTTPPTPEPKREGAA